MRFDARQIAIAGVVAAMYLAITITPGISAISYGPIQVRIAEALTVLPFLFPGAIFGVFAGCLLANIFGIYGLPDIILGSLLTLIAAWLTWQLRRTGKMWLAPLPPIVINTFGVPAYVGYFYGVPYWPFVFYIAVGQAIACYVLGLPLLVLLKRRFKGFN